MSTGSKNKKKIRVAFLDLGSREWTASLHYLKNLLYAVSKLENGRIEPVILAGTKTDKNLIDSLMPFSTIIRSSLFDEKSFWWFVWRLVRYVTGSNIVLSKFLERNSIQVISHSRITGDKLSYKTINWIPDFQHLHLPEMFSEKENSRRNRQYKKLIKSSDAVIVSSHDALNDLNKFMPGYEEKIKVVNFVSQPSPTSYGPGADDVNRIEGRYSFSGKFFYLPNQFWKHKNHMAVFKAVSILKDEGKEILVLCSGHMNDWRNKDHIEDLKRYLTTNNLDENIRLLGLIDYQDVFSLMRYSLAVINPSLFEGWSSTVEECKSIGKGMILSDLNVHREQDPSDSVFFTPHNAHELAGVLRRFWDKKKAEPNQDLEEKAREELVKRTREFGLAFQNVVLDLVDTPTAKSLALGMGKGC